MNGYVYSNFFSGYNEDGTYTFQLTASTQSGTLFAGEGLFTFLTLGFISLDSDSGVPAPTFTRSTDFSVIVSGVPEVINNPPVAVCQNVSVSADASCQANANVDNGSFDPDGGPVTLVQSPAGPCGLGTPDVTLTVTDDMGASDSCTAIVTVVDTTLPTISSASASPNGLWPPNHKMVSVTVSADASDACDATPVCQITEVTSNEPIDGLGDGDTAPDWEVTGDLSANLRAERSGEGSGRIYTIEIECVDASGNASTTTTTVTVPHDKGGNQ